MKSANKMIKMGIISLMLSGQAFADGANASIGLLQANDAVTIQNKLGSFPVSGDYTIVSGDQIRTKGSKNIVTVALGNGYVYVNPDSVVSIVETQVGFSVSIISGSVGYKAQSDTAIEFLSAGDKIVPTAGNDIAGAIALGLDSKTVVSAISGDIVVLSDAGLTTNVLQGQTWVKDGQEARLLLTQELSEDDDDDKLVLWILASIGVVAAIASSSNDDDDDAPAAAPAPAATPAPVVARPAPVVARPAPVAARPSIAAPVAPAAVSPSV